jgi:hypothetical protein
VVGITWWRWARIKSFRPFNVTTSYYSVKTSGSRCNEYELAPTFGVSYASALGGLHRGVEGYKNLLHCIALRSAGLRGRLLSAAVVTCGPGLVLRDMEVKSAMIYAHGGFF